MARRRKTVRLMILLMVAASLGFLAYTGRGFYGRVATIGELLTENRDLKQAISNLTTEDQIGYAKVTDQQWTSEGLKTTITFVETARNDKLKKILDKQYAIDGDVVHFDALIVKFGDQMVISGKSRAMYIWRRVYGEATAPKDGLPIEEPGIEPKRYSDLLEMLPVRQRRLFWANIWDLANDPEKLALHGIQAIYGNAVYTKLRPGLIYIFKIGPTGQVYPEVVPDI